MVEYSTPSASLTQSSFQKDGILTWAMMDPEGVPWKAAFENTMHKRTTYYTLTLELSTSASQ